MNAETSIPHRYFFAFLFLGVIVSPICFAQTTSSQNLNPTIPSAPQAVSGGTPVPANSTPAIQHPKISTTTTLGKDKVTGLSLGELVMRDDPLEGLLDPKVAIVLDSSGSMGQLLDDKFSRMHYAKKLFQTYLQDQWREKAQTSLFVYGGRRKEDCDDIYQAIKYENRNLDDIEKTVKSLSPVGRTPIQKSLEMAIDSLKTYPGPKRLMLFTDGEETCGGDSCELLEKVMKEKIIDLEMFTTGIGMEGGSADLDGLRCLGPVIGAPKPEDLQSALNTLNNRTKSERSKNKERPNVFVDAPNPMVSVVVYKSGDPNKSIVKSFVALSGAYLPPGQYDIAVQLNPVFTFASVTIPPKKRITLKVAGVGTVKANFFGGYLDVEVLDRNKKPIYTFPSDEPHLVRTGRFDIRLYGGDLFERTVRQQLIAPGGVLELPVEDAGVVEIATPQTVAVQIFTGTDKLVGKQITNHPFVIRGGTYRFFVNEKCDIPGITIKNDRAVTKLQCPAKP